MSEKTIGTLTLTINNDTVSVQTEEQLHIEKLLEIQDVESPDMVSVQHNGRILNRDEFSTIVISDGDEINFLYFMGGGNE